MDLSRIAQLRGAAVPPARHIIDGERRDASDGGRMPTLSPLDGEELTTLARGTRDDAEAAVAAARRAFDDGRWQNLAPAARKAVMLKWAELIEAEALDLAVLGVRRR